MKTKNEMVDVLLMSAKDMEKTLGIQIRNGQAMSAIKATIAWVIKDE